MLEERDVLTLHVQRQRFPILHRIEKERIHACILTADCGILFALTPESLPLPLVGKQAPGFLFSLELSAIPHSFQIGLDSLFQFGGFGEQGVQFGYETGHLFLKGVAVVFHFLSTDVAAGSEDVAV